MKTLNDSIGNPAWVAEHIKELREIFPVEYRGVSAGFLMRFGAALQALGVVLPEDDDVSFETLLVSLRDCGVCEAKVDRLIGRVLMRRGKVQAFEREAVHENVERLLTEEPPREMADEVKAILQRLRFRPSDF